MPKRYYSIAELAALKLPGYPAARQNWYGIVEREAWVYREAKARGGRNGTRREYLPPEHVARLIAGKDLIPMRFMGESDDVTMTLTVSFDQAGKILRMLRGARRG